LLFPNLVVENAVAHFRITVDSEDEYIVFELLGWRSGVKGEIVAPLKG